MAKRFLDTNLFRKRWIRELDTDMKLFWIYLLTDCDHAGIWDVDVERASFQLKLDLDQDKILKTFDRKINNFKVDKWFIPKFVQYQYGELNPNNKAHLSVIKILTKYGLYEGLTSPLQASKDKEKDNVKYKFKDKVKVVVKKKKTKQEQLKEIEDNLTELKKEFSSQDVYFEFDKFKDYLLAHGKRYSQYNSAFKNWLRGNEKRNKLEDYDDLLK
tara:strand:+ start:3192 stop:3836 length:645 start_codon:yes stop_codon:yes gene_type:complete